MDIYNEQMEPIENPDLSKGRLERRTLTVHHPAVQAVEEVSHYEVLREYPNGGKDVVKVVDVPGAAFVPAWDEEVPFMLYRPYTQEELEQIEADRKQTDATRIAALEEELQAAKILLGVE